MGHVRWLLGRGEHRHGNADECRPLAAYGDRHRDQRRDKRELDPMASLLNQISSCAVTVSSALRDARSGVCETGTLAQASARLGLPA